MSAYLDVELTLQEKLDLLLGETTDGRGELRRYRVQLFNPSAQNWGVFDRHGRRFLEMHEVAAMQVDELRQVLH